MAQSLRVLLFNADGSYAAELRSLLLRIPGLKIVGELDEISLLPQAVSQFPIDLVVAHLDPDIDFTLEITRQVIENRPGLSVFAVSESKNADVVLRALRAGVKEFLVKPLSTEELQRALGKIQQTGGAVASREPGKLISLIGCAGGVGASTIAVNLATELASLIGQPRKVALVDLDFRFGHLATMLDIQPQFTIADLCQTAEQIDRQMIDKAVIDHPNGVRVLARPNSFEQAESITAAHCASVLSALGDMCDYVIVDGPARNDPGGQTVIDAADCTLMIVQMLVTSVRNADRMCQGLAEHGFNLERVKLVCNRVGSDPGFLDIGQIEKTLGRPLFAEIPDDWSSVSASINIGQPLAVQWSKSRVRMAIRSLAQKLHSAGGAMAEESAPGGMFGRLLGGLMRKKVLPHGERGVAALSTD